MLKKSILLPILLLFSISGLCQTKVAILPVIDKQDQISYAHKLMLRSNITTAITNTEGWEGYDRIDLSSVMDEQDFQRKGLVSDNEIHKIGEMTGADFVLIAEAAKLDESHLIASAKIVNVESAKITNSSQSIINISDLDQTAKNCQTLTIQLLGLGRIGANHSMVTHATGEIKTPLFEIHKIVFANVTKDHTIITDFEGQLYSDEMRYLVPKVYYNGLCADNVSVDLFFKIFNPSGELKVGKISPQNYTGKVTHTMRPGKHAFRMKGWGRENGGAYPAGKYKYELWSEGKLLFSTCFEIKSR